MIAAAATSLHLMRLSLRYRVTLFLFELTSLRSRHHPTHRQLVRSCPIARDEPRCPAAVRKSVAIVESLMENLAIAMDGAFKQLCDKPQQARRDYSIKLTPPHYALTPTTKIVARLSRERKWILFLEKLGIFWQIIPGSFGNESIAIYAPKHRGAAATASPFAPMRTDCRHPAFS